MKRFTFLAALFAPLAIWAQRPENIRAHAQLLRRALPKPKNGECPVCGTKAPPFKPTVEEQIGCAPTRAVRTDNGLYTVLASCDLWTEDNLPKSTEVTCAKCRVKFVQDAVK